MEKMRLALIAGGKSSEREVSLKSAAQVYEALDQGKYDIRRYDPLTDLGRIVQDAPELQVALIIMHGRGGEDGCMQGFLDLLEIPYQGSGVLASALAMNKELSKALYQMAGLKVPNAIAFSRDIAPRPAGNRKAPWGCRWSSSRPPRAPASASPWPAIRRS